MKKVLLIAALIVSVATPGFASVFTDDSADGQIVCGATNGNSLSIGLSPNVTAGYTVANNTGVNDFFVIGTYHTQGDEVFATAQTLTKIYTASAADSGQTMATIFDTVPQTAANAASDAQWSGDLWTAQ